MLFITYTGKQLDYSNITPESICLEDMLHSVCRINRFIGHSKRPYPVAEHLFLCLVMSEVLGYTARQRLLTVIHDLPEAYTGDCPTPLKQLLPQFKEIEAKVEDALYKNLGIAPPTAFEHNLVKRIDNTMLVIEMRDMTLHDYTEYINDLTYIELLDDKGFSIYDEPYGEDRLHQILDRVIKELLEEVKNEV